MEILREETLARAGYDDHAAGTLADGGEAPADAGDEGGEPGRCTETPRRPERALRRGRRVGAAVARRRSRPRARQDALEYAAGSAGLVWVRA